MPPIQEVLMSSSRAVRILLLSSPALPAAPLLAQQTGAISGKVTDSQGGVLPGVTVEARSDVLPGPRVTVTAADGEYRLPALPPGGYTLTFTLSGMQTATRRPRSSSAQETTADAPLGVGGIEETVTVTAETTLVDKESATLKTGISNDEITSPAGRPGVPRPAEADPRRAVPAETRRAAPAPAAAARTTCTSSTAST